MEYKTRLLTSSAQTTDDVGVVHSLLRTFPSSVSFLPTVLTQLVLVVAQSTVEGGQFSELIPFVIILSFGSGGGLRK